MRYTNTLNTLQARSIIDYITKNAPALHTRYEIENFAVETVGYIERVYPDVFPVDFNTPKKDNPHFSYLAFTFAHASRFAIKSGDLTVLEYISILASVKEENEKEIADYGAFGDLFEILIRCAFIRKYNLVSWSALSVKAIDTSDMISKKYGIIEIGQNGKTLSHGTVFDFMSGDYTSIVYGVFSEEDKKAVYSLCRNKDYEKALDYVTSYSSYWESKYQFESDMNSLTRGKGITIKSGSIQVVYNSGKYNAFVNALENGTFTSLYEFLNR